MNEERFFAIRRTDGEPMGGYSWTVASDANDWEQAEYDSEGADRPEAIEYEICEMTVRRVAVRKLPENPHVMVQMPASREPGTPPFECEYCGEPWPCEWMRDHATTH